MDFIDELKHFSKRVESLKDNISTEEATKTSIIMPFFQLLGYDVFNPNEFVPEFTADVGIKKGEKVDYAIIKEGKPVILIEAKWCGDSLDKYDSQLFRYFGTSTAKFAILTNGILYRFYTDLDEQNKMDVKPFLEVNILDIKDSYVNELKKFHKANFDIETIFNTASELKYANEVMKYMDRQLKSPSDGFIKFILGEIYSGVRTQSVIDRFRDIIKRSLNQFVNELMNDKITSALKSSNEDAAPAKEDTVTLDLEEPKSKVITTELEMESYYIVKSILGDIAPREKITYKDTETYFGVLFENNTRKWICRFKMDSSKITMFLPDDNKNPVKYILTNLDEIYNYRAEIKKVVERYITE